MKYCNCNNFEPGLPYQPGQCYLCWLFHNDKAYREYWGGSDADVKRSCIHAGKRIGLTVCDDGMTAKVSECRVHGTCTRIKPAKGIPCCTTCDDYVARTGLPDDSTTRNLLFHIYPIKGNGVWQRDVLLLKERIRLFNGKRIVAIVTGQNADPPERVKEMFGDTVEDYIVLPNNPALREVLTFEPLFSKVETLDPTHITLYAQAKGVTRATDWWIQEWVRMLYEIYLDYWPIIDELLLEYPIAGAFKKIGRGWPERESLSDWHYSGSWLWFRNKNLFEMDDWRKIERFWSGIEPYPSLHFKKEEAGCIFYEGSVPDIQLYNRHFVATTVMSRYEEWVKSNADRRFVYVEGTYK